MAGADNQSTVFALVSVGIKPVANEVHVLFVIICPMSEAGRDIAEKALKETPEITE